MKSTHHSLEGAVGGFEASLLSIRFINSGSMPVGCKGIRRFFLLLLQRCLALMCFSVNGKLENAEAGERGTRVSGFDLLSMAVQSILTLLIMDVCFDDKVGEEDDEEVHDG